MRVPLLLFALSACCAVASAAASLGTFTAGLAISTLSCFAALLILLKQVLWRLPGKKGTGTAQEGKTGAASDRHPAKPRRVVPRGVSVRTVPSRSKSADRPAPDGGAAHIVIDGSNVMHWNGATPRLATLRAVIATLRDKGWQPGIIFDANAGYAFADRYLDDVHFAKLLDLPADRVLVVGKGQPADPTILSVARALGAKVLTNDKYRDWAGAYPEVAREGLLVRGGFRDGDLWLDEAALASSSRASLTQTPHSPAASPASLNAPPPSP